MFVKVCGITTPEQIEWAVSLGYSAVGFVLHPGSVRYRGIEAAQKLALCARGRILSVAVGLTFEEVDPLYNDVDYVQIYERKMIDRLIYGGTERPETDFFDYFIYDASQGSGEFHQPPGWTREMKERVILSGGLSPENVRDIVTGFHPFGIDVSSGVERDRGEKDYNLMSRFINEVKDAEAERILR